MKHLTYAEHAFLHGHLSRVRHVTLDPDGPGVVRIHLVPCAHPDRDTPFVAILNGRDILPLSVSWAILLANLSGAYYLQHDASGLQYAEEAIRIAREDDEPVPLFYGTMHAAHYYLMADSLTTRAREAVDALGRMYGQGGFESRSDLYLLRARLGEREGDTLRAYHNYARAMECFGTATGSTVTAVYLAYAQPGSLWVINLCVFIEQFGYGFGFTAYMLYLMYFAEGERQTAHYAICTAFMALGMMLPGMMAGWLQELIGYRHFFIWVMICCAATIAVCAFIRIRPDYGKEEQP